MREKETYARALREDSFSKIAINNISEFMRSKGISIEESSAASLSSGGTSRSVEIRRLNHQYIQSANLNVIQSLLGKPAYFLTIPVHHTCNIPPCFLRKYSLSCPLPFQALFLKPLDKSVHFYVTVDTFS
jgi:hypothetical protein